MIRMVGFKKSWGLLGGAVSCLVALSLIVAASCAPLCAGAACLPQNASTGSEAGCHGMTSHNAASIFQAARTAACQFGDAAFAIVGNTGFEVNWVSPAVEFLAAANPLQSFVSSYSEVWVSIGPPGILLWHIPSLVLRV